jgi:hypothetical protein
MWHWLNQLTRCIKLIYRLKKRNNGQTRHLTLVFGIFHALRCRNQSTQGPCNSKPTKIINLVIRRNMNGDMPPLITPHHNTPMSINKTSLNEEHL